MDYSYSVFESNKNKNGKKDYYKTKNIRFIYITNGLTWYFLHQNKKVFIRNQRFIELYSQKSPKFSQQIV